MRIACVGGRPACWYFALATKLRVPGQDSRDVLQLPYRGWTCAHGISTESSTFIAECPDAGGARRLGFLTTTGKHRHNGKVAPKGYVAHNTNFSTGWGRNWSSSMPSISVMTCSVAAAPDHVRRRPARKARPKARQSTTAASRHAGAVVRLAIVSSRR